MLSSTQTCGGSAITASTLTLIDVVPNRAPVITSTPITGASVGTPYRYDAVAADPDANDTQRWTLPLSPAGMTVNATSGRIDWTSDATRAESVELPNLQCRLAPAVPATTPFTAAVTWRLTPGLVHTPLVGRVVDTNGDGVLDASDHPSVIVAQGGRLLARDGVTGAVLWQSPNAEFGSYGATPALGDTDGDGWPEIYSYVSTGAQVVSFTAQGVERWRTSGLTGAGGTRAALALADLDGDGQAEILAGRNVLTNAGSVRWSDAASSGWNPMAVDLDGNGTQEVLTGLRVLNADGTLRWTLGVSGGVRGRTCAGRWASSMRTRHRNSRRRCPTRCTCWKPTAR